MKKPLFPSQKYALDIYNSLVKLYPDPTTALDFETPWQLLVAVILSAQCTDVLVNKVTKVFFKTYPDFQSILDSPLEEVTHALKQINYFKTKAKNIYQDAQIIKDWGGIVPTEMDKLLSLHGVGRKVANVVIHELGGEPQGFVVDTHVTRLSQRLGLSKNKDPKKIEQDLVKIYKKDQWRDVSHLLIFHGRAICKARNPLCEDCILNKICPSAFIAKLSSSSTIDKSFVSNKRKSKNSNKDSQILQ